MYSTATVSATYAAIQKKSKGSAITTLTTSKKEIKIRKSVMKSVSR